MRNPSAVAVREVRFPVAGPAAPFAIETVSTFLSQALCELIETLLWRNWGADTYGIREYEELRQQSIKVFVQNRVPHALEESDAVVFWLLWTVELG